VVVCGYGNGNGVLFGLSIFTGYGDWMVKFDDWRVFWDRQVLPMIY
jgi:hypothetical protein